MLVYVITWQLEMLQLVPFNTFLTFKPFFILPQLIPDDMEFQSGDMPNYTTSDGSVCIFITSPWKPREKIIFCLPIIIIIIIIVGYDFRIYQLIFCRLRFKKIVK